MLDDWLIKLMPELDITRNKYFLLIESVMLYYQKFVIKNTPDDITRLELFAQMSGFYEGYLNFYQRDVMEDVYPPEAEDIEYRMLWEYMNDPTYQNFFKLNGDLVDVLLIHESTRDKWLREDLEVMKETKLIIDVTPNRDEVMKNLIAHITHIQKSNTVRLIVAGHNILTSDRIDQLKTTFPDLARSELAQSRLSQDGPDIPIESNTNNLSHIMNSEPYRDSLIFMICDNRTVSFMPPYRCEVYKYCICSVDPIPVIKENRNLLLYNSCYMTEYEDRKTRAYYTVLYNAIKSHKSTPKVYYSQMRKCNTLGVHPPMIELKQGSPTDITIAKQVEYWNSLGYNVMTDHPYPQVGIKKLDYAEINEIEAERNIVFTERIKPLLSYYMSMVPLTIYTHRSKYEQLQPIIETYNKTIETTI